MRKIIYPLLLSAFMFVACGKDDVNLDPEPTDYTYMESSIESEIENKFVPAWEADNWNTLQSLHHNKTIFQYMVNLGSVDKDQFSQKKS